MMKLNMVRGFLELATRVTLCIAGVGLLLMMVLVILDVSLKYLFNAPVPGTLEMVSFYAMATCAFLPFAYVQKTNHHIVMTLATERMRPKSLRILLAVVHMVSAAYLFLFAWASGVEAIHMSTVGESTSAIHFDILIWPARWCVPVSTFLMGCWMLMQTLLSFTEKTDD